jgi:hypothetical protein
VAEFGGATWGGVEVRAADITSRVLQVAIPGEMTAAQSTAFRAATERAAAMGVTLTTTVVR